MGNRRKRYARVFHPNINFACRGWISLHWNDKYQFQLSLLPCFWANLVNTLAVDALVPYVVHSVDNEKGMFMYKYVHNQVADCVNELFTRTNKIHNRVTRQSDKIYIPFSRLSTVCKSVRFKGPLIWTPIYDDVGVFCCIGTFKSHLKKYLLTRVLSV